MLGNRSVAMQWMFERFNDLKNDLFMEFFNARAILKHKCQQDNLRPRT